MLTRADCIRLAADMGFTEDLSDWWLARFPNTRTGDFVLAKPSNGPHTRILRFRFKEFQTVSSGGVQLLEGPGEDDDCFDDPIAEQEAIYRGIAT